VKEKDTTYPVILLITTLTNAEVLDENNASRSRLVLAGILSLVNVIKIKGAAA